MRTVDWSTAGGTILEFLVHQQLSPGVTEPRRASIAQTSAALINAFGIPTVILNYLTDNGLWIADTGQANQMLSGDATHGVKFRAELIAGPISRHVWTPRSTGVTAIDITPGGSPTPVGTRYAWYEVCSFDFLATPGSQFHSMRLSANTDRGSFGTFLFNGLTSARPIDIYVGGVVAGTITDPEYTLSIKGGIRGPLYTIADNAAQAIDVPAAGDPKWAILTISRNSATAPSPWGTIRIKAGTGNVFPVAINLIGATVNTDLLLGTGVLTGSTTPVTTAAGALASAGTIAITTHTDGKIYIQNRLGGSIVIGTHWIPQS